MATHSRILGWRILWTEEPGGLQSMGSQRVKATKTFTLWSLAGTSVATHDEEYTFNRINSKKVTITKKTVNRNHPWKQTNKQTNKKKHPWKAQALELLYKTLNWRWFLGAWVHHLSSLLAFWINSSLSQQLVFRFFDLWCCKQYQLGLGNNFGGAFHGLCCLWPASPNPLATLVGRFLCKALATADTTCHFKISQSGTSCTSTWQLE